jgi:hypothetical protein
MNFEPEKLPPSSTKIDLKTSSPAALSPCQKKSPLEELLFNEAPLTGLTGLLPENLDSLSPEELRQHVTRLQETRTNNMALRSALGGRSEEKTTTPVNLDDLLEGI